MTAASAKPRSAAAAEHDPIAAFVADELTQAALMRIVAERGWQPPQPRFAHDQIVGLRVAFADVAVRDRVKQAGGTWNPERRVWQLRYDRVVALGLNSRIVDEPASNSRCPGAS